MDILITVFLTVIVMLFISNHLVNAARHKCQRENEVKNNATFIIVLHNWHVHSKGFTIVYSDALTIQQARIEAKVLCQDKTEPFSDCAYTVVPILSSPLLSAGGGHLSNNTKYRIAKGLEKYCAKN